MRQLWFILPFVLLGCAVSSSQVTEPKAVVRLNEKPLTQTVQPICVEDSQQAAVCLQAPAERIVVLFESALDGLYMLQQGHKVVGVPAEVYLQPELHQAYGVLDQRIAQRQLPTPSKGANATNIESLLLLQPDLVVMGSGQTQMIQLLKQMGIAVYVMQSSTYTQVKDELSDLAVLTDANPRAKHILNYTDHVLAQIEAKTAQQSKRQSIYYAWSGGRIFSTSGRQSITNNFIELAGAYNIVPTITSQPNVNPETLIEWNPDNIVLWNTDPQLVYQRKELQALHAVQQHRVINLSPTFIYNPHTIKIVVTAAYLNQQIYPEQSQVDAEQIQLEVLTQLYGETQARALFS